MQTICKPNDWRFFHFTRMNFLKEIPLNAHVKSNRNQQVWYNYQYKHDPKLNKLI